MGNKWNETHYCIQPLKLTVKHTDTNSYVRNRIKTSIRDGIQLKLNKKRSTVRDTNLCSPCVCVLLRRKQKQLTRTHTREDVVYRSLSPLRVWSMSIWDSCIRNTNTSHNTNRLNCNCSPNAIVLCAAAVCCCLWFGCPLRSTQTMRSDPFRLFCRWTVFWAASDQRWRNHYQTSNSS